MGAILWVQLNCSSCNGLEEICCNIEYCLAWYTVWLACTGSLVCQLWKEQHLNRIF